MTNLLDIMTSVLTNVQRAKSTGFQSLEIEETKSLLGVKTEIGTHIEPHIGVSTIWKSKTEIYSFNQENDIKWCKGMIADKYVQNDKYCVDIKSWYENQRHEIFMLGESMVLLPSREHGPVLYPESA